MKKTKRKKEEGVQRFIIYIRKDTDELEIDTPDGPIDYETLLNTIQTIMDILLDEDPTVVIPDVSKKELN